MSRTRYRSPDDPDEPLGFDHGRVDWLVDVLGVAVHEAARVAAMAAEGEVLVTAVTRDLAAGVGLSFQDRGEHQLRGFDGGRRLLAIGGTSLPLGVPVT